MAVKIGDVTIRIGASTKQLEADLRKAERSLQATAGKFTELGESLSIGITAPVAAFAAVSLQAFGESAQAIGQVEAALTSTENAANKTIEGLKETAKSLSEISTFDDDEILGKVTANLLTFTSVAGDQFDKAQLAIVNLSTRLGTDLQSATLQVGKALNDPVAGLTSLKKAGIQFSEEQKNLIKNFAETNQLAKAQDVILAELERQFGGSAQAAAKLGLGPLKQLQNQLGNLAEVFGEIIADSIGPLVKSLTGAVKSLQGMDGATKKTIVTVAALAATVGPLLALFGSLIRTYTSLIIPITRLAASMAAKAAASNASAAAQVKEAAASSLASTANTAQTATAAGAATALTAEAGAAELASKSNVTFATTLRAALAVAAPYLIAIGALGAAIYAIYKSYQGAEEEANQLNKLQSDASAIVAKESAEVKRLVTVINDETESKEKKKVALNKLQEIQPQYFQGIKNERDMVAKVNIAYEDYIKNLQKKAAAQVADKRILENADKRLDLTDRLAKAELYLAEQTEKAKKFDASKSRDGVNYSRTNADAKQLEIDALKKELNALDANDKKLGEFINTYDQLIQTYKDGKDEPSDKPLNKYAEELKNINEELKNNETLLKAGLITGAEAAEKEIGLLQKKLETLVLSGLSPTSSAVLSVKERLSELSTGGIKVVGDLNSVADSTNYVALELLKLENAFEIGLIDQSELSSQKISVLTKELQTLSDQGFAATSTEVQKLKKQLEELTGPTYNIKGQLPDTTTTDILTDLNKELAIIQDKTDAGLFGDLEGDEQKLQTLKNTLSKLIEEGLGDTDLAKNIQGQIGQLTVPENPFAKLGEKLYDQFSGIAEQASAIATPFFGTLNQLMANKSANLDEYYAKEKALIENSTLTEEQKAQKLGQLDAKVLKERKKIARDQAKISKAQAIFDATINGALAALKVLSQTGNPILAAVVGALAAAQVAAIAAQPLPSLAIGTDLVKRDGLAMIHKGEAIVPANVAKGGFSGRAGGQLTGKLSGIDILISAENSRRYLNKVG